MDAQERYDKRVEVEFKGCSEPWLVGPTSEHDDDGNPCYAELVFDGANRGIYIVNAVVDLARELGWTGEDSQDDTDASIMDNGDLDVLLFNTETEATSYLNDICPDDWSFGWDNGDFYLANEAWWRMVSS